MSGFVGLVPAVRIRLSNLPLKAEYPSDASVEAVVDTGYEGFIAVPREVFAALRLDEMVAGQRTVEVADGRKVRSRVAYATVAVEGADREIDGAVETMDGLTEILIGARLLSEFRLMLDYCLGVVSVIPCR